jgi:hypothetical protein
MGEIIKQKDNFWSVNEFKDIQIKKIRHNPEEFTEFIKALNDLASLALSKEEIEKQITNLQNLTEVQENETATKNNGN